MCRTFYRCTGEPNVRGDHVGAMSDGATHEELDAVIRALRDEVERLRAEIDRLRREHDERPPHYL